MATKKNAIVINRLDVISAKGEILKKISEAIKDFEKDTIMEYKVVGKESEQATDWRTGELKWEDEEKTIPYYRDKYDYVRLTEEEMTSEKRATLVAIDEVKAFFDKITF